VEPGWLRNFQGDHQPGKPEKVGEFDNGQGKVRESGKSQEKVRENVFLLPVGCSVLPRLRWSHNKHRLTA